MTTGKIRTAATRAHLFEFRTVVRGESHIVPVVAQRDRNPMARARLNADCGTAQNRLGALPRLRRIGRERFGQRMRDIEASCLDVAGAPASLPLG
ncbi:hypothetical protein [Burkholderia anthina]|uniref:hypothetical protein n=1 Tax=Burkholderia anthina TaxID=179879 RepID=UPI0015893ACD|nr:hypothetical protein [Burkholderia anthina]